MKTLARIALSFYPVAIFLIGLVFGAMASAAFTNPQPAIPVTAEHIDHSPWVTVMESEPKKGVQKYLEVNQDTIKYDYSSGAVMVYIKQVIVSVDLFDKDVSTSYGYARVFCDSGEYSLATLYNNKGFPVFDWGTNQTIKEGSGAQKVSNLVCSHQV